MKRFSPFIASGRLLAFAVSAVCLLQAPAALAADPVKYPELKTSSKFSQMVQRMTGFTALSSWVANNIIRKEIGKHIEGDVDSKLKLYSGTDLLGGKAKTFSIEGQDLLIDKLLPLSEFKLVSDGEMPLYVQKGSKPFLLRPVKFKLTAMMSEGDLNRMLQSEAGKKKLTNMKVSIPPFGKQAFDVIEPTADIHDGKVSFKSLLNVHEAPVENALPVEITGKIGSDASALKLSDLDISVEGMGELEEVSALVEHYFTELVDPSHIKIKRHKMKINWDKTDLVNDQLLLEATVTVSPDEKLIRKLLTEAEAAKSGNSAVKPATKK